MIRLQLYKKKNSGVVFLSHHIRRHMTLSVVLICLGRVCQFNRLYNYYFFFSCPILLLESASLKLTYCQEDKGQELLHLFKGEISTNVLWLSFLQKICLILSTYLIYSLTYLYYHGFNYVYSIIFIVVQYCVIYIVAQIASVLTIGNSFSLTSVSLWHATIWGF